MPRITTASTRTSPRLSPPCEATGSPVCALSFLGGLGHLRDSSHRVEANCERQRSGKRRVDETMERGEGAKRKQSGRKRWRHADATSDTFSRSAGKFRLSKRASLTGHFEGWWGHKSKKRRCFKEKCGVTDPKSRVNWLFSKILKKMVAISGKRWYVFVLPKIKEMNGYGKETSQR